MKQKLMPAMAMFVALAIFTASCKKENDKLPGGNTQTEILTVQNKGKSIEKLSAEYFASHEDEKENQEKLISVTTEFLGANKETPQFENKKPCHIQPIYAYGIDGVAYYEVWFTEDDETVKGWILVSATDKDLPMVNFSNGKPYSSNLMSDTLSSDKIYRFGVSYFVLERNGQKVKDYGVMPAAVFTNTTEKSSGGTDENGNVTLESDGDGSNLKEGIDYTPINDYQSLKQLYPEYYYSAERVSSAQSLGSISSNSKAAPSIPGATPPPANYKYRYVTGQFSYFLQIPPNTGHNTTSCYSGCNNNAWASLYGWWDLNKGKGNLIPTTAEGEASPQFNNTTDRKNAVDPVQMQIRSLAGTYCSGTTGNTYWSRMHKGYLYAKNLGYGYSASWYHCWFSGCSSSLANIATQGIANNGYPVIIGANSHMYVGYGWMQDPANTQYTYALCYPAWKENHDDDVWIHWRDFCAATRLEIY